MALSVLTAKELWPMIEPDGEAEAGSAGEHPTKE
jgi:hypothetical protein